MRSSCTTVFKICRNRKKGRRTSVLSRISIPACILHAWQPSLSIFPYREQQEANARREAERTIKSLRKDVDDATLSRMDLERRVETLQEELELLRATSNEVSF